MSFPSRHRRGQLKSGFATKLRVDATDAERKLWSLLRSKQLGGFRFRRQQPIGPYIVDFFCSNAKLVVELDGDQHGADKSVAYDEVRSRWLQERGYCVLRFPNWQVFKDSELVIGEIVHALEQHDIPLPEES